jgi:hypothetical protein
MNGSLNTCGRLTRALSPYLATFHLSASLTSILQIISYESLIMADVRTITYYIGDTPRIGVAVPSSEPLKNKECRP